jgi:hypothetical protein
VSENTQDNKEERKRGRTSGNLNRDSKAEKNKEAEMPQSNLETDLDTGPAHTIRREGKQNLFLKDH